MEKVTPTNLRIYGPSPYGIAVLHGGPGAAGEMAPVAEELGRDRGVLEPLQTQSSLDAQIDELREVLEKQTRFPITLIGWSWGAWLAWIFAARHPERVQKIILVGSGPFEPQYAEGIMATRMSRLELSEQKDIEILESSLSSESTKDKDVLLRRLGNLIEKADTYAPISHEEISITVNMDIHQKVWAEASSLRKSGQLLELASKINCEVVAIHGDYDPHPADGVSLPLMNALPNFRFILLEKCGHKPWIEKYAREKFYAYLRAELALEETA